MVAERTALRKLARLAESSSRAATTTRDLLDRETQLDLFRWRDEHLLAGRRAAAEGRHRRRPRPVRRCSSTARTTSSSAARAWVDLVVLEAFAAAVERARTRARGVLDRLCDLYALHRDRGRARLVPGARPAVVGALEGGDQGGQRAVRASCARTRASWSTPSACRRRRSATRGGWRRADAHPAVRRRRRCGRLRAMVICITGASSGIGEATARRLAREPGAQARARRPARGAPARARRGARRRDGASPPT